MANKLTPNEAKAVALHEEALTHLKDGQSDAALPLLKEAALLAPTSQAIAANLGFAHLALDEDEAALACFKRAVALQPNWSLAHYNAGLAHYKLRQVVEAKAAYEKALRYKPDDIPASINLALCYLETLELDPALELLHGVLDRDPDNVDATLNLAKLWNLLDRPKQAVGLLKRLADKVDDDIDLLVELGSGLRRTGDYKFAAAVLDRAKAIDPDHHGANIELARILIAWRRYKMAITLLTEFEDKAEHKGIVWQLLGIAYNLIGRLDDGHEVTSKAIEAHPENISLYLNAIFSLNYRVPPNPVAIHELNVKYDQQVSKPYANIPPFEAPPLKSAGEKLRVAFISPDFREHSCSYFVEGLFAELDRDRFEVIGIPNKSTSDSRTAILKRLTDAWVPIHHLDYTQQTAVIRDLKADIVFDLAGHTSDHALFSFAQRVAPVQINWLGYPNTTGLQAMDYRFVDEITDPVNADRRFYSETLVRLPGCFLNYSPPAATPIVLDKSQNGQIVLGSFNSIAKVNLTVIDTWIEIMRRLPNARLMIKAVQLDEDDLVAEIFEYLDKAGIDGDRLEVLSPMPSTFDHLNTYNEVDIALDTFPYNGTTTTCEASWMGVPVVTCVGEVHSARVGASLNTALGLPELIGQSIEEYIDIAVALATDIPRLRGLQAGLRDQMQASLLCERSLYAGRFSDALTSIWQEHVQLQAGEGAAGRVSN
ncbi:MAG: tetratricopeptide repeat protein [Pseudomonadota bacterium]